MGESQMKRRKFLQQSVGIAGAISVVGIQAPASSDNNKDKKKGFFTKSAKYSVYYDRPAESRLFGRQ